MSKTTEIAVDTAIGNTESIEITEQLNKAQYLDPQCALQRQPK